MIIIIHGSDTAASRNFLFEEKAKHSDSVTIDATKSLTDLVQALSGDDLFGGSKTLFLEEFITEKKSLKELEAIIAYIIAQEDKVLYLWEKKELSVKQLHMFPKYIEKKFTIPKIVFTFLDAVLPHNAKKLLTLYHQLLEHNDAAYIFFMLTRHVRMLLAIRETTTDMISEVKRLASWQKEKLKKQSIMYSQEQLLQMHEKIFKLELEQKTGGLSISLDKELDFLLSGL